jgi:hypothetical protein
MKYEVRCIKHKAQNKRWVLQSGLVYEAIKKDDNEIEIVNHYGQLVTLSLKEFQQYCKVIRVK